MNRSGHLFLAALIMMSASCSRDASVSHLSADFLEAGPSSSVEVRSARPALSWRLEGDPDRALNQKSYRVLMATSADLLSDGRPDVWDSGEVRDASSVAVRIPVELDAGKQYFWTVKVGTGPFSRTGYAAPMAFRTADTLDGSQARHDVVKEPQKPVRTSNPAQGVVFLDFGKDAYGQLSFSAAAEKDAVVNVHFGEAVSDGRVLRDTGASSIRYQCVCVPIEKGEHDYSVEFPHDRRNSVIVPGRDHNPVPVPEGVGEIYPFRYCEFELPDGINVNGVTRYAVRYPFDDDASSFECSDPVLNEVWDLCKYSIKATTAFGIYIDGDRERIPYEADALINQLGHYCTDSEYALARYSVEYLCRNATWPTEWILQAPIMAWNDYMYTGDATLLERNYDILKARTLTALREKNGLISTRTGLQTPELMKAAGYAGTSIRDIVDWPQSGAAGVSKESAGEADAFEFSDYNAVVNAYHYNALVLMSRIADVLGHQEDAAAYAEDAAGFGKIFNESFYDSTGGCYRDGPGSGHHSLHSSMFALDFGLVPGENAGSVLKHIRSRGMACSVYGAQFLIDALYGAGDADYAYELLAGTGLRSWYNMIRSGSTVTLEAWDSVFKPNLDWNHAWGAAPANLIPRGLMGITPLEPGYAKVRVKPQTGPLEHAGIVVPSIRGQISLRTELSGQKYKMDLTVPANMRAEVWIPKADGSFRIRNVRSGRYSFTGKVPARPETGPKKVGITTGYGNGSISLRDTYVESVRRGGNIPFVLPLAHNREQADAAMAEMDALILTGGEDVDPRRYGEESIGECVEVNSVRDTSDFCYAQAALEKGIRILAICRGEQLLNVALGGSLYQDLPSQYEDVMQHRQTIPAAQGSQTIYIEPGSRLRLMIGADTVRVNSFHHEAVKRLAPGLKAAAHAPDGVIEAYEGENIIGVQFHPEAFTNAGQDTFLELFKFDW